MTHHVKIFTDGGCMKPPGPKVGAWAAVVVIDGDTEVYLTGSEPDTTNNRMEIMGMIQALEWLDHACHSVLITSDSQYTINGIQDWVHKWRKFGWKTYSKEPVKNRDLWERLYALVYEGPNTGKITFQWVKGHTGHHYNELADSLCTESMQALLVSLKS